MRILLISANTETLNMPTLPMGLACVAAAVAREGHTLRFLDLMGVADGGARLRREIQDLTPEVIGISIRNVDDQVSLAPRLLIEKAREVVAICRQSSDAPVVLGGAGYSIFPEAILAYLGGDMGIQGEGEAAFCQLLARLAAQAPLQDVPGLFLRSGGLQKPRTCIQRLDDWPAPDPALFDATLFQHPSWYLPFQTRRGCPLRCSYCATGLIEGTRIRRRDSEIVVTELARWRRAGFSRIFFVDNTFNLPPGYATDLCNRLAAADLDLQWRAIVYPGRVNQALVRAMARAGCQSVSLGFESGNQQVLDGMGKHFDVAQIRHGARLFGDAGIERMGFLLLGGPDETRASVLESLAFADKLALEMMRLTCGMRIYPGTRLADIARKQGIIQPEDDLLQPRFYITPGLESWLRKTVAAWCATRPHWEM